MNKKIFEFQPITDGLLNNDTLLWAVGDATSGLLFKPTIGQLKKLVAYTPPVYTTGSVLFAAADGKPAQDNASFFWNDSTNRLALGGRGAEAAGDLLSLFAGGLRVLGGAVRLTASNSNDATAVNITAAVTNGWHQTINIDQSAMDIWFKHGNGDGTAGISKPRTQFGANEGILRIYSNVVSSGSFTGRAVIALATAGVDRIFLNENGVKWQNFISYAADLTTGDIPDQTYAVYRNSTTNTVKMIAHNGGAMIDLSSAAAAGIRGLRINGVEYLAGEDGFLDFNVDIDIEGMLKK